MKKHLLIILFFYLDKDPRVLREFNRLKKEFDITVAAWGADGLTGFTFVPISGEPRAFTLRRALKQMLPKALVRWLYRRLGKTAPEEFFQGTHFTLRGDTGQAVRDILRRVLFGLRLSLAGFSKKSRVDAIHHWHYSWDPRLLKPDRPYDAVLAIDIDTLPLAFQAAAGAPVIFDAHEYFLHEYDETNNPAYKKLHVRNASIGSVYVPHCNMVTVSEGLAELFGREYGKAPEVVYSGPEYADLSPAEVTPERIRLVHHGRANPDRKLELMIDMFQLLDERFTLDMYLSYPGEYGEWLRERAAAQERVRILPPVPMLDLPRHLNAYDMGIFLLPPTNLSLQYALPNKFFEFIQARLGIAVGPTPDMARIIRRHELGVVSGDFQPRSFAEALNALSADAVRSFKHNAHNVARKYCAETNMDKFAGIIQQSLGS